MTTMQERGKKFYGGNQDINHAKASFFTRHDAGLIHRGDTESLARSRQAQADLDKAASKHGMSGGDVHEALTALHEHETLPRSQAALEARRAVTWKNLCEDHGGESGARAALAKAANFQKEFAAEVPYLAERMVKTGAVEDPRVVGICAKYGSTESTKEK
jgi:hypothetical protein